MDVTAALKKSDERHFNFPLVYTPATARFVILVLASSTFVLQKSSLDFFPSVADEIL